MLGRRRCELRMETFEVESCIQGYHVFKSIWNPTTGEELNCMRERTNTEDLYTVAVIRRSAVIGHVPQKMSAACALFLRRNHLRLVLFNTQVQSCHEKFGLTHVWVVHMCVMFYYQRGFKFGTNLSSDDSPNLQIKVPAKFSRYTV